MPQYALMVWGPAEYGEHGSYADAEENEAQRAATVMFTDKLRDEGNFVFANGLAEASASTVVDGRGDTPIMTDGPYLESKEHVAGLWIIEAADMDGAVALAAEGALACRRPVEVRPVHGG
jgi:hypothetical protein